MRIRNAGQGIHAREIPGIASLRALPADWYAFANLELYLSPGKTREVDVFVVLDDRILLVDLKDWHGKIETEDGRWFHNDRHVGPSPVDKVREAARSTAALLRNYLSDQRKKDGLPPSKPFVPLFQGCVVISGTADITRIAPNEKPSVFFLRDFVTGIVDPEKRDQMLGPAQIDRSHSLLESNGFWRQTLGNFFNVETGRFRPRQRLYGSYRAISDSATYDHRANPEEAIYHEFDAEEDAPSRTAGLLRIWDFSRAAVRFQTENGRREIAGREREVIAFLTDRNEEFESLLLRPAIADHEISVVYWEVFEKRRQLQRLRDVRFDTSTSISDSMRIDLARSVLQRVAALHDVGVAHLDIGEHSVWFDLPSTVRLSHLFAASYPTLHSLGADRYQFLTAGWRFPEDGLGDHSDHNRRDVFLLGSVVHYIFFGTTPRAMHHEPPDWDPNIDQDDRFARFHEWFKRALSWDASSRFKDAREALSAYNVATGAGFDTAKLLQRLNRFRSWADVLEVTDDLPNSQTMKRSDTALTWRSDGVNSSIVVKLWKRSCWTETRAELPRLVNFLEQAERLSELNVEGIVRIERVAFLDDGLVLAYRFVPGVDLEADVTQYADDWKSSALALAFVRDLTNTIVALHGQGIAHGDLKPKNIVVRRDAGAPQPVLIDLIEFPPAGDGEVQTRAYAPASGGPFERDRYAVTKIADEMLARTLLSPEAYARLGAAAEVCRLGPPENATLLPLLDALNSELAPPLVVSTTYRISVTVGPVGLVLSDEGVYGIRRAKNGSLVIRGATEEVELTIARGAFVHARRRTIEQRHIARVARYEFRSLRGELVLELAPTPDFRSLEFLIADAITQSEVDGAGAMLGSDAADAIDDDRAQDEISEAASVEEPARGIDVPELWQSLIDIERELYTEGTATGDSVYNHARRKHIVQIDLDRGAFDFDRHDRVVVRRAWRNGAGWSELGLLDVGASTNGAVLFDASGRSVEFRGGPMVRDGDRLRFQSMMETYSRTRRETATTRILSKLSSFPDLVTVFSGTAEPQSLPALDDVALDQIAARYDLNEDQKAAFARLLSIRPIGLLQGPPGTGKSKFIADFIHYAVTSGLARNVLLASQSHEAVNNATEAVMLRFRRNKNSEPSLVRVGQEQAVSADLRPFHSDRLESQYKERFRAEFRERLAIAGARLGLEPSLVADLSFLERVVRPVCEQLEHLLADDSDPFQDRIAGLRRTASDMVLALRVELPKDLIFAGNDTYARLVDLVCEKYKPNKDRVRRFISVAKLAHAWLHSMSNRQRSFESFLAGTRSIVAGTCVGLGRTGLGLTETAFDLVVVDEAARCTASELAVPMQSGRWVVLVGDQLQLEPQHRPEVVERVAAALAITKREILESDFSRLFRSTYGSRAGCTLRSQYRMLEPIGEVVSRSFYEGKLSHGRSAAVVPADALPPRFSKPLLWVSTDTLGAAGFEKPSAGGRSQTNESEADAIIEILQELDASEAFRSWSQQQTAFEHIIGVICFYAAQRDFIRRRLSSAGLSPALLQTCKVDTVDSYQGKQNPIIIVSVVRNNADGGIGVTGTRFIKAGFLVRPNRINVAMSRAMDRLIVVGACHHWRPGTPMAKVATEFQAEVAASNAAIEARVLTSSMNDDERRESRRRRRPRSKALREQSR